MNPRCGFAPGMLLASLGFGCAGSMQETREAANPVELATVEVAHQRQGMPLPTLPESARPPTAIHASYRICVDGPQGRTIDARPLIESLAADSVLLPALRAATWQLSGVDGPLCFLENLVSNPDGSWRSEPQPYLLSTSERMTQAGDAAPALPPSVQQRLVGKSVVGLYRMCLTKDSGAVSTVTPVVSIPGADADVTTALRSWHYKASADAACWIEPLLFTLNAAPSEPSRPPVNAMPTRANSNVMTNIMR